MTSYSVVGSHKKFLEVIVICFTDLVKEYPSEEEKRCLQKTRELAGALDDILEGVCCVQVGGQA